MAERKQHEFNRNFALAGPRIFLSSSFWKNPIGSDLPGEDHVPVGPRAAGVGRGVTGGAVGREEGGDVGDGGQHQRAGQRALLLGQRDHHVVLVPHVEGIVGKRVRGRMVARGHMLQGFLVLFFVGGRAQQAICRHTCRLRVTACFHKCFLFFVN